MSRDFQFKIDPAALDIAQNKTGSIVDTTSEVSVYICPDRQSHKVLVDLSSRTSDLTNTFTIPLADTYNGDMVNEDTNIPISQVAVHDSAFRCFNLLRVKTPIDCYFMSKFFMFVIETEVKRDDFFINLKTMISVIKGK